MTAQQLVADKPTRTEKKATLQEPKTVALENADFTPGQVQLPLEATRQLFLGEHPPA